LNLLSFAGTGPVLPLSRASVTNQMTRSDVLAANRYTRGHILLQYRRILMLCLRLPFATAPLM